MGKMLANIQLEGENLLNFASNFLDILFLPRNSEIQILSYECVLCTKLLSATEGRGHLQLM